LERNKYKNKGGNILLKSPIKWMGGKSKSVKTILPIIPEHECYIEPFLVEDGYFLLKNLLRLKQLMI
jgi:DNA adenine methylase